MLSCVYLCHISISPYTKIFAISAYPLKNRGADGENPSMGGIEVLWQPTPPPWLWLTRNPYLVEVVTGVRESFARLPPPSRPPSMGRRWPQVLGSQETTSRQWGVPSDPHWGVGESLRPILSHSRVVTGDSLTLVTTEEVGRSPRDYIYGARGHLRPTLSRFC